MITPALGFEPRYPEGNRLTLAPSFEAYALKAYALIDLRDTRLRDAGLRVEKD